MAFEYGKALTAKIPKKVDESIIILELMEKYGQSYEYFTEELDICILEIMKSKMGTEAKQTNKTK